MLSYAVENGRGNGIEDHVQANAFKLEKTLIQTMER